MKPRAASNVRCFTLQGGGLLLVHLRHPKRIDLGPLDVCHGEDVEDTIQRLEDRVAALRSMRDRLEAER